MMKKALIGGGHVDRGVADEDERHLMRFRSLVAVVATAIALTGVVLAAPAQAYPTMPQGVHGPFAVTGVVDGDTIHVTPTVNASRSA